MNTKIWFAIAIALLLPGCGNDSTTESSCRTFATKMEVSGDVSGGFPNAALPATVVCDFDMRSLRLMCQAEYVDKYGSSATQTKIWTYSAFEDFAEEGRIFGITRSKSYSFTDTGVGVGGPFLLIPNRPIQGTNTFDADHRLLTSDTLTFSAWDAFGRPTASLPTNICTQDQGHGFAYDEARREVIHSYNSRTSTRPPDMSIPCIPYIIRTTFDSQGNVIAINEARYKVSEMKTVCVAE